MDSEYIIVQTNYKCPICNGRINQIIDPELINLDANNILICEQDLDHRFYKSPFDVFHIFYNPNVTIDTNEYVKKYVITVVKKEIKLIEEI